MERVELNAQTREIRGKQVSNLRAARWIPAVVYGPDTPSNSIQIEERELTRVLSQAGATALINLYVDGEKNPQVVLARDIQREPIKRNLLHVDFYQVRLTEKVKTVPPLEFVGVSSLIESGEAMLNTSMTEVEVECLPTDLISSIEVDISVLASFDDTIQIRDLPVPDTVTVLVDADEVVASLVSARMAEIPEEVEEVELAEEGLEDVMLEDAEVGEEVADEE